MKRLALLLALAACGDSSGPGGVDPIVQIVNNSSQPVAFEWRDGQGVFGADTIRPGAQACENFFARADSAYFHAEMFGGPMTDAYTAPWFDPTERHAWTMTVSNAVGFLVGDASQAPC